MLTTPRSPSSGLFVYTTLNGLIWTVMILSRGAYEPKDYHRREYWTWKPAGEKPWIFRVFTKTRFWEDERLHRKKLRGGGGVGGRGEADESKEACDAFAMSEVDLGSLRATSFAPSSTAPTTSDQRVSAIASEAGGAGPHGLEEMERGGEMHELEVVVVPQQVHVVGTAE